jgi:hypothetical protein
MLLVCVFLIPCRRAIGPVAVKRDLKSNVF